MDMQFENAVQEAVGWAKSNGLVVLVDDAAKRIASGGESTDEAMLEELTSRIIREGMQQGVAMRLSGRPP